MKKKKRTFFQRIFHTYIAFIRIVFNTIFIENNKIYDLLKIVEKEKIME